MSKKVVAPCIRDMYLEPYRVFYDGKIHNSVLVSYAFDTISFLEFGIQSLVNGSLLLNNGIFFLLWEGLRQTKFVCLPQYFMNCSRWTVENLRGISFYGRYKEIQ